jgi:hypothetical protein
VLAAGRPLLALIDQVDAKPEASWPYEVLMPCRDANLGEPGGLVFVLAGSSGSTLEEFRQRIAARPKGADLLSRIPQSNNCVIAPMDAGDQVLAAISQMLDAAAGARSLGRVSLQRCRATSRLRGPSVAPSYGAPLLPAGRVRDRPSRAPAPVRVRPHVG